jgi:hypothetical protein
MSRRFLANFFADFAAGSRGGLSVALRIRFGFPSRGQRVRLRGGELGGE